MEQNGVDCRVAISHWPAIRCVRLLLTEVLSCRSPKIVHLEFYFFVSGSTNLSGIMAPGLQWSTTTRCNSIDTQSNPAIVWLKSVANGEYAAANVSFFPVCIATSSKCHFIHFHIEVSHVVCHRSKLRARVIVWCVLRTSRALTCSKHQCSILFCHTHTHQKQ